MKRRLRFPLLAVLALGLTNQLYGVTWQTDFGTAKLRLAAENKPLLMLFTGSDWCPACQKLKRDVLVKPEFTSYAEANVILFEADFPRYKAQPGAQKQAYEGLAKAYNVRYFPTLILLDTRGIETTRLQYDGNGAKSFVSLLEQHVQKLDPTQRRAAGPGVDAPLFNGAAPAPPQRYTDLLLKNISGTKERRFALVNNQTFAAGETARVKLAEGEVKVRCVEIREKSVVVTVDGQPGQREIYLQASR